MSVNTQHVGQTYCLSHHMVQFYEALYSFTKNTGTFRVSLFHRCLSHIEIFTGVKSTHVPDLSKSISNAIKEYRATSESLEFKMYLSRSMKVMAS